MIKIIKKLLVLGLILALSDLLIGMTLQYVLKHSPDGRYFKAIYSLSRCNEDVIIFGSSRAETNFAPFVFKDSLGLSCWNSGRGGQSLPFWYAMELAILKRHTPKIAIVNIERDFLTQDLNDGWYERAGFLRPFYYDHPEIRPVINKISKFEKYLVKSKIYAYNSSFYYLFRPFFFKNLDGKIEDKGWKTVNGTIANNHKNSTIIKSNKKLNKNSVDLFNEFINHLNQHGCKVFLIVSPNYKQYVEFTTTIDYCKNINNIQLIDYSNCNSFIENHLYYKDAQHLNVKGAIEFSKMVCSDILTNQCNVQ